MTAIRKLPIGIQDFEKLRTGNFLYVDKTRYVYDLAESGAPYFLGRPRRFGKSLFLSTLKAYFLGKKELFDGLAIAELEKNWTEYPVFYLDFNVEAYTSLASFQNAMNTNLYALEEQWGRDEKEKSSTMRMQGLIRRAFEQTGRKVVVLVDEYDKPLIETMDNARLNEAIRKRLKGFYGVLKSADAYLRFAFMTGVTKFAKVSVFSDLNHLLDISMSKQYASVCGITEAELIKYFEPEIQALANEKGITYKETLAKLKKMYDGYHFANKSDGMYNPFSLFNTFFKTSFDKDWFASGTPTLLVNMLKHLDFDIKTLDNDIKIPANSMYDYRAEYQNPVPLLYQSGYLTIKSYDEEMNVCTLGYPNEEVKYGFYNELLPAYMQGKDIQTTFYAASFIEDLRSDNVEAFMTRIKAFFADIPNRLNNKKEKHFQTVFYLLFKLMGQFVEVEYDSAVGRADAIVITKTTVYVFEFKLTERGTAEDALRQIDEKGYLRPFLASGKRLVKVGVEFDIQDRGVARWTVG